MDLSHQVQKYFDEVRNNEFSRLRAWEFIYGYTRIEDLESLISENNIEKTALHLGLYLAQFGMFRPKGNLLYQNLNYFKWLANFFIFEINRKFPNFYTYKFENFSNDDFCKMFDECVQYIAMEKKMLNPTDTLISKIFMGIWGEVPAYDTQFIKTSKKFLVPEGFSSTKFKSRDLRDLYLYSAEKKLYKTFPEMKFEYESKEYSYPLAKKIDFIFWCLGN